MMMTLLALKAKAIGALSGVLAQAIAVCVMVLALFIGIWWIRHDARMDERRAWEARMATARAAQLVIRNRQRAKSEEIAQKNASEWAQELVLSAASRRDLEDQLARRVRTVCYPKDIIKALNK